MWCRVAEKTVATCSGACYRKETGGKGLGGLLVDGLGRWRVDAVFDYPGGNLSTALKAQLVENVAHVHLDGSLREVEAAGDRGVA